jgi:hypothetical protein
VAKRAEFDRGGRGAQVIQARCLRALGDVGNRRRELGDCNLCLGLAQGDESGAGRDEVGSDRVYVRVEGGCQGDFVGGASNRDGDAVCYGGARLRLGGCEGVEYWVRPCFAGDIQEGAALLAALEGGFGAAAEGGG